MEKILIIMKAMSWRGESSGGGRKEGRGAMGVKRGVQGHEKGDEEGERRSGGRRRESEGQHK